MIKQTRVSDLDGETEIPDGTGYEMRLIPHDGRKKPVTLDVSDDEAKAFIPKGREVSRRGRSPQRQSTTTRRREAAAA